MQVFCKIDSMGNTEKRGTDRFKILPRFKTSPLNTRPFKGKSNFGPQVFILFPHTAILLNRKTMTDDPGHRECRVQERIGTGNNQFSEKHRCVNQFHCHSHFIE